MRACRRMPGFHVSAAALAALLVYGIASSCSAKPVPINSLDFTGETMGTTYNVRIAHPTRAQLAVPEKYLQRIDQELNRVDSLMSTYRADSELMQFNGFEADAPFPLSDEVHHVFRRALTISEETEGAFDVTVGPLVNAWGFGPDGRPNHMPSTTELDALKNHVGFTKLKLDPSAKTITKSEAAVFCDLSAIAKGYGSDRVAAALTELGCDHFMVEVGGEVQTRGLNADGVPWRVAIETPEPLQRSIYAVAGLSGTAMATSGDYRNFYDEAGRRLSHTIDPRTAAPITHNLASVSVLHRECALADGYATALMVMGEADGYRWATENGIAAYFIMRDPDGKLTYRVTEAFEPYLVPREQWSAPPGGS